MHGSYFHHLFLVCIWLSVKAPQLGCDAVSLNGQQDGAAANQCWQKCSQAANVSRSAAKALESPETCYKECLKKSRNHQFAGNEQGKALSRRIKRDANMSTDSTPNCSYEQGFCDEHEKKKSFLPKKDMRINLEQIASSQNFYHASICWETSYGIARNWTGGYMVTYSIVLGSDYKMNCCHVPDMRTGYLSFNVTNDGIYESLLVKVISISEDRDDSRDEFEKITFQEATPYPGQSTADNFCGRIKDTDAPTSQSRTTDAPITVALALQSRTTDAPNTDAPTSQSRTTDAPNTVAPTLQSRTTDTPITVALALQSRTTDAPNTVAPTLQSRTTDTPKIVPISQSRTTDAPKALIAIGATVAFGIMVVAAVIWRRFVERGNEETDVALLDLGFKFDAFIIYSTTDEQWVKKKLLSTLEKKHNMKCCIHYRDFLPGVPFVENMAQSVYNSRKTIAVVSKSFLSSNYCNHELNIALHRLVERGDNSVIVIKLDDVEDSKLPIELQFRSYIDFTKANDKKTWEYKLVHSFIGERC